MPPIYLNFIVAKHNNRLQSLFMLVLLPRHGWLPFTLRWNASECFPLFTHHRKNDVVVSKSWMGSVTGTISKQTFAIISNSISRTCYHAPAGAGGSLAKSVYLL